MSELKFVQLSRENGDDCAAFSSLVPAYMKEIDDNAGIEHSPEMALKWAESMINIQGACDRHLELCFDNEALVGFLYGKIDRECDRGYKRPDWGYIMEFYVLPKYRRRGYGKAMFARLTSLFKCGGAVRMYLTADPVSGEPFWEAVGFRNSGEKSCENGLYIFEKDI